MSDSFGPAEAAGADAEVDIAVILSELKSMVDSFPSALENPTEVLIEGQDGKFHPASQCSLRMVSTDNGVYPFFVLTAGDPRWRPEGRTCHPAKEAS